ncbi:WFDC1 isoform 3 [Pan troglodytes]|uniref:WFDC1 isoform 3 n=1 Tax=Pan troglodytes TaxID=9598 RepID=A0A2J8LES2_PANTR|nr:WFDC1 isoform 3 [Pan troglodytes]
MPLTGVGPGSCRRQIIRALCLLLLLLHTGSAKNIWKRALPARLAEKSRVSAWDGEAGAASVGGSQP